MQKRTLSELRAFVLAQADMTGTTFIDATGNTNLDYFINVELSELHDLLVASFGNYFMKRETITVGSSTDKYRLPDDCFKILKVYHISDTNRTALRKWTLDELEKYSTDTYDETIDEKYMRYNILNDEIWFAPKPASSGTIEIWYVPGYEWLTDGNESIGWAVPVGWEDFVVCGAAARCLIKEESDPSALLQQKAYKRKHIVEMAADRDLGEPDRVSDQYSWISEEYEL